MSKSNDKTSKITKDNEDQIIDFYARELFDNTTLPQMLSIVQSEALKYADGRIKGDKMPESEKLDVLTRMLDFEKSLAEQKEKLEKESSSTEEVGV